MAEGVNGNASGEKPGDVMKLIKQFDFLDIGIGGKIHCSLTNRDLPLRVDAIQQHINSKKLKKEREWYNADFSKYEPFIVPHATKPKMLSCTLTGKELNRIPKQVEAHVNGKRFRNRKKEFEESSKRKVEREEHAAEDSSDEHEIWVPSGDDEIAEDDVDMSELAGDGAEGRGEDPEEEKRRSSHGLKKSQGKKEGIERRKDGGKGVGKKEKAGGVDEAKVDRARRGQSDVSEPGVRQGRGVKHAKLRREGKGGGGTSEGIKKHPVAKGASAITKSKQKMKNGDSFSVIGPLSGEASAVSNGSKVAPASTSPTTVSVEKKKLGKQKKGNNKKGSRSNDEVDGSRNATGESGAQQKREESMADGVAVSATKKWPSVKRKNKVMEEKESGEKKMRLA